MAATRVGTGLPDLSNPLHNGDVTRKRGPVEARQKFMLAVEEEQRLLTRARQWMASAIAEGRSNGLTMVEMAELRGTTRQALYDIERNYGGQSS